MADRGKRRKAEDYSVYNKAPSLLTAGDDLANLAEQVLNLNRNRGVPVEAILADLEDAVTEWRKRRG